MTPQELKNSILQLAIQGKLVEQRPEEGTAQELYRKIQEEKQQLIRAGKINKEKPLPEITEEEKPFEIPESWMWVKLGNIVYYTMGKTPPRAESQWWGQGIPWVSIADMPENGHIQQTKEAVTDTAVSEIFGGNLSKAGTLLMSFKLTVGRVSILDIDAVHNEAIISIYPIYDNEKVMQQYLFKVLPFISQFGDSKNAIKGKTLNRTSINNMLIALPPLAEQKRIVAKIEEILPYIDHYEQAWSRLEAFNQRFPDDMRKSILQQAVQGQLTERDPADEPASELLKRIRTERVLLQKNKKAKKSKASETIASDEIPFDIPDTWAWVNLGWICQKIGAGSTPKGGSAVYVSKGVKLLREQNIHDDGLHLDGVVYIDEATHATKSNSQVQSQDILMNITGGSIGRNALVPDDFDTANVNQHVLIIRLVDKSLRHYLHYCFSAPVVLNQMFTKQAGDKPGLSATKVENFLIPLPPLAEQKRIVARLEELLAVCGKLK